MTEDIPAKNVFELQVAGLSLKLRSSHDHATVQELASMVDQKVNEALTSGPQVSFQNALLLASLHIAEELVLFKRAAESQLGGIERRAQLVLKELEESPITQLRIDN